jgi:regulator of PEP synthase PpsR (kinase-PPPase family)
MKNHVGQRCTYADLSYVKRDVENARALARSKGYTEIDVTGRAMEETSSLIVSKLQERFPELHII